MGTESMAPMSMSPESPAASASSGGVIDSPAANLRTDLNYIFGEHLMLTAKATDAALGGRTDEFNAYADMLNQNGTDIGAYLGTLYGQDAQDQFNEIWTAHIGYFVDYTKAVAAKDDAAKADAMDKLDNDYTPKFTDFIVGATGLPQDAVSKLVSEHVTTTEAAIDAQASGDWAKAYAAVRTAFAHMSMIGDALAPAIATKNNLSGDPMAPAVSFRTALDQLLEEHLYLTTFATDAAIGGRTDEYTAAANVLADNGKELGAAIGKVYGQDAQDQFNEIWTAHIGYFVDYTTALANGDDAGKQTALDNLNNDYVPDFAAFLAGATGLPETDLAALTADHVATTVAVIEAQKSGDQSAAAMADRTAGMHMRMIGDPLAAAIVAAKPDAFE
jgi:hypothetical protein